jgi:heat shock protein HslJ
MQQLDAPTRAGTRPAARVIAALAAAALALAACTGTGGGASSAPSGPDLPFEGTDWRLTEYVGKAGGVVAVRRVEVTATFADGTVAGNGGCNAYRGPYTLDGETIAIGDLAATAMACTGAAQPVEEAYFQILPLMTRVAVAGDTLELANDAGTITLRYEAAQPVELTETKWVATSINNGRGAVESVTGDVEVTAIFGGGGSVAGSGGCNTFNGPYTVDGSTIAIGPLMSTKMACPTLDQETAFFAALAASTTFAISGDTLELRDDEGALQVSFAAAAP